MKKIFFLVLFFLLLSSVLFAQEKKDWTETPFGSMKIERFYEETVGNYTCTYTIVSYKNTTSKTWDFVEIKATIRDEGRNIININTRSFFSHAIGDIYPGFEDSIKIPVEARPGVATSVSVSLRAREK